MSQNTDALQKGYDAFGQGDMDTIRSIWTDDFYWQGPDYDHCRRRADSKGPTPCSRCSGNYRRTGTT